MVSSRQTRQICVTQTHGEYCISLRDFASLVVCVLKDTRGCILRHWAWDESQSVCAIWWWTNRCLTPKQGRKILTSWIIMSQGNHWRVFRGRMSRGNGTHVKNVLWRVWGSSNCWLLSNACGDAWGKLSQLRYGVDSLSQSQIAFNCDCLMVRRNRWRTSISSAMFAKIHKNAMSRPNPNRPSLTLSARQNQISAYQWILLSQLLIVAFHVKIYPFGYRCMPFYYHLSIATAATLVAQTLCIVRAHYSWYSTGFIASLVGLYLTYRTAFGLDVGIAFLLLCAVSKLLGIVYQAWWLCGAEFITVCIGRAVVNQPRFDDNATSGDWRDGCAVCHDCAKWWWYRTLPHAHLLVGQAIPLTIILFYFSRLPPLWSVHLSGAQAKTGMSDSMSPGDFANPANRLNWHFGGIWQSAAKPTKFILARFAFSDFDGTTWRANPSPRFGRPISRLLIGCCRR